MSVTSIVCSCGQTIKTPGATPGRVGKCPHCGALIKVPEAPVVPQKPADPEPIPPSFFYENPGGGSAKTARKASTRPLSTGDHGPINPPRKLETRFRESLLYPLWAWSSVAMLIFLPPILTIGSTPLHFVFLIATGTTPFQVAGWTLLIPSFFIGSLVFGYVLIYMSHILTSSAFGEALPPRRPDLQSDSVGRIIGRWFWAIAAGFVLGFVPSVAYWIYCGEVDLLDWLMILNLAALGVAYSQMALLAVLLHDDPLAANPVTVIQAILRVGWDYAGLCFLGASWFLMMGGMFVVVESITNPLVQPVMLWLFWLILLYSGMVVLRRQGLFCRRHKVVLAWFPDRPMWGR